LLLAITVFPLKTCLVNKENLILQKPIIVLIE